LKAARAVAGRTKSHVPPYRHRRNALETLIRLVQFAGRANQPVRLHQDASAVWLRPQRKADADEGYAK